MLVKKELQAIPVGGFPKIKEQSRKGDFAAAVQTTVLPRCGKILVVDVFEFKSKELKIRFFSDGANYINLTDKGQWTKSSIAKCLGRYYSVEISALPADIKKAHAMLKNRQQAWAYLNGLDAEIRAFTQGVNSERRDKEVEAKAQLQKKHFAMFPALPKGLENYCNKHVFPHTYIFIDKALKGARIAKCGLCGQSFTVPSKTKHLGTGTCPCCKKEAQYIGSWYGLIMQNKAKICVCHRAKGQLLMRWANVQRYVSQEKVAYKFDDEYYALYIKDGKKQTLYSYKQMNVQYWGYDWYRLRNGSENYDKAYLYTSNLRQVFGRNYYNVDLGHELSKSSYPLNVQALLNNLKNWPAAEYLVRLGMYRLAAELVPVPVETGDTFASVLGVSKQYLEMYQKFNVSAFEHRIVKTYSEYCKVSLVPSSGWVSMEVFEKIRRLNIDPYEMDVVEELFPLMTIEKLANYFSRQKELYPKKKTIQLMRWYRDYVGMCKTLNISLNRKGIRYPKNIKIAHDGLVKRFEAVIHEKENEEFRKATELLYANIPRYQNHKYMVVLPENKASFIREGQTLQHCVGTYERYFKEHMLGKNMIFFLRKIEAPDTPFYTVEINMSKLRIVQLQGFSDREGKGDIRKFAEEFIKQLRIRDESLRLVG